MAAACTSIEVHPANCRLMGLASRLQLPPLDVESVIIIIHPHAVASQSILTLSMMAMNMGTLLINSELLYRLVSYIPHPSYTTHSMCMAQQQALNSADVWLAVLKRSSLALGCKLLHVHGQPKHLQCVYCRTQLNLVRNHKGSRVMRNRKDCCCNLDLEDGARVSLPVILSSSMVSLGFLPHVEPSAPILHT